MEGPPDRSEPERPPPPIPHRTAGSQLSDQTRRRGPLEWWAHVASVIAVPVALLGVVVSLALGIYTLRQTSLFGATNACIAYRQQIIDLVDHLRITDDTRAAGQIRRCSS